MKFNKQAHIEKMQPVVKKFLAQLSTTKGISFIPTDGEFENVILKQGDKEIRISHHSFYRYSGICCLYEEKGDGEKKVFKIIDVTDEMFLNTFIKPIIDVLFNPRPKK